jgi:hypothetical protein
VVGGLVVGVGRTVVVVGRSVVVVGRMVVVVRIVVGEEVDDELRTEVDDEVVELETVEEVDEVVADDNDSLRI